MRVLVACPTYAGKDYALASWWAAYDGFDYPEREAFMVDTTPGTLDYARRLRRLGIPAQHVEPMPVFWDTMEIAWRLIIRRASERACSYVASIEADMVCPPDTLSVLVAHCGGRRLVAHSYPDRTNPAGRVMSLGCCLIETAWLADSVDLWRETVEEAVWGSGSNYEMTDRLVIEHLDG